MLLITGSLTWVLSTSHITNHFEEILRMVIESFCDP